MHEFFLVILPTEQEIRYSSAGRFSARTAAAVPPTHLPGEEDLRKEHSEEPSHREEAVRGNPEPDEFHIFPSGRTRLCREID